MKRIGKDLRPMLLGRNRNHWAKSAIFRK